MHAEARRGSSEADEGPSLVSALSNAGSDKVSQHGYDRVYTPLFEPLRAKSIRMLEIGVDKGRRHASVGGGRCWRGAVHEGAIC